MTHDLIPHSVENLTELVSLYNDSYLFAKEVGDLDWSYPFPEKLLVSYIENQELYGLSATPSEVQSSVRLYENETRGDLLFIGRLAVSRVLKGSRFTQEKLLPAIVEFARDKAKQELRLTCLADNKRLVNFYLGLGFHVIDERPGQADAGYLVRVKELALRLPD